MNISNANFGHKRIIKSVIDRVKGGGEGFYLLEGEGEFEGTTMVVAILSGGFYGFTIHGLDETLTLYLEDGIPFASIELSDIFKMSEVESAEELGYLIGCWWEDYGAKEHCEEVRQKTKQVTQNLKTLASKLQEHYRESMREEESETLNTDAMLTFLDGLDGMVKDILQAIEEEEEKANQVH